MKLLISLITSLMVVGTAFATPPTDLPTDLPDITSVSKTEVGPGSWQWDYGVD